MARQASSEPPRMTSFPEQSVALIQGASRGIGLAFVRQLLAGGRFARIHDACRNPEQAEELQALAERHGERVRLLALDTTDEASIATAVECIAGESGRLHLLINSAGILHDDHGLWPEKRLADIDPEHLHRSFAVNAFGPLLMAKHCQALFRHRERAVFASLSARVGSIGDNRLGGWYAYRGAKAAQNMFTRTIAIEFGRTVRNAICVALHPGTTGTGLSQPFQGNVPEDRLFSADFAAQRLLTVIDGLRPEHSGTFFAWDGQPIPW